MIGTFGCMYFYFVSNYTHSHFMHLKKSDDIKQKKFQKKIFFPKVINLHLATIGQFLKNIFKKYLEKFSKKNFTFFSNG